MGSEMDRHIQLYGKKTILLVDDEEEIRKMLGSFLKMHGYAVIEAEDGQQAVDNYADNIDAIGLVLMDVLLPKKNGVDAANEIWETSPDARIIFMSGYGDGNSLHLPANSDFVSKPFDVVTLIEKIVKANQAQ
jgi:DNA-binding NtrC family response regulator